MYLGSLAAFIALQIPTIKASNFGMLLAFRFLNGFVGSPIIATGGASIADLWRPAKKHTVSAYGVWPPSWVRLSGIYLNSCTLF